MPENHSFDFTESKKWVDHLKGSAALVEVLTNKPLVSIILPTKDRIKVLSYAIDSVLAQTYPNWELLIVDDGSVDGSLEMLQTSYQHSKIKVLKNLKKGVSSARNTGLTEARGTYIAYLDSDNTWLPEYLELMLGEIVQSQVQSVYCSYKNIDGSLLSSDFFQKQLNFEYAQLVKGNFIDLNTFLHHRSLYDQLGGFDENLKRTVDWELILRYTQHSAVSFAYFIGAIYDNTPSTDRITNKELPTYVNVIRNNYLINWGRLESAMTARDMELTTIILYSDNNINATKRCLKALFSKTLLKNVEVIVVNGSRHSKTHKKLLSLASNYPYIKIIQAPHFSNYALACNLAVERSRGGVIVFIKNNVEVTVGWLDALLEPLTNPIVKGVQPNIIYSDKVTEDIDMELTENLLRKESAVNGQASNCKSTRRPRKLMALARSCLALRAEDLVNVKGFDPLFFCGQETIDLCLRVGQGKVVFQDVPNAVVTYHQVKAIKNNRKVTTNQQNEIWLALSQQEFSNRWQSLM